MSFEFERTKVLFVTQSSNEHKSNAYKYPDSIDYSLIEDVHVRTLSPKLNNDY